MSRSGEEGDEVVEEEEYVDVASWQREFDKMLRKERASYASGRLQVSVFVAAVAALLQLFWSERFRPHTLGAEGRIH
jgi:hypothetical protein